MPPTKESGIVRDREIRISFRADDENAKLIAQMLKITMSALTEAGSELDRTQ